MKMQVPVSTSSDKIGKRSLKVKPGRYMFRVDKFAPYANNGNHLLHLEIVWADKDGQEEIGKIHQESMFSQGRPGTDDTEWSDRLVNLALACGVITKEQIDKHHAEGTAPEFDFENDLPGKFLVGELEQRGDYINVGGRGFALFHVNSPESKNFPVLDKLLQAHGISRQVESKANSDLSNLM